MIRRLFSSGPLLAALLMGLAISVVPASGASTTMPYTTLPELVEMSELIVRGTVTDQRSFIDTETGRITTHTEIEVETEYLGELDEAAVDVEQWGGTVGERALKIPGNAHYRVGEEVVLFLEYNEGADDFPLYLVAMTQAKFHVESSDDGEVISRSLGGVEFLEADEASGVLESPSSFAAFESRLQSLIYAHKRGGTSHGE